MSVENTVRPARYRFAEIASIYMREAKSLPESVEDGWIMFERAVNQANSELCTGLWLPKHEYEGLGNTICNRIDCGHTLNHPIHN